MPRGLAAKVACIAGSQLGLITRAQLVEVGLSERAIDFQISAGLLYVVHPGVYRLAGVPRTWEQSLLAALLAGGHACAISHLASAVFWELEGIETDRPHLLVPHARRLELSEVVVHRTRLLPTRDLRQRRGLLLTAPARTLLDLAGIVTKIELEIALDDTLRRRIATLDQIRGCLNDRGPNGVKGWGRLNGLVDERVGAKPTGSGKETRFRRGLIQRGLPLPISQYEICDEDGRFLARVDFAYPAIKLAIEVDSPQHADRMHWESDLSRQNRVNLMRWHFLRFPRTDRRGQREAFETIEAALRTFGEPDRSPSTLILPKQRKKGSGRRAPNEL